MKRSLALLVAAFAAQAHLASVPPARALASDWAENPESRVRLVTPYRVAPEEGEIWFGVHFRLTPEWHVYWKNSGDAGFAPAIGADGTPELTRAELLWPAPERYELPGDLVAFGYEDEVVYPVRAEIAAAGRDRVALALRVDYLVCQVDCVPYGYDLRLDQPVGPVAEADPDTAPLLEHWRARVPVPAADLPGVETRGSLDFDDLRRPVLTVTVDGAHAAPGRRPELFLEAHDLYDPGRPELEESPDGLRLRVPLGLLQRLDRAPESAELAWTVTGLAAPAALAERAARGDGSVALEARRTVSAGGAGEPTADGRGAGRAAAPAARVLLGAFAGGLVLAATPGALALLLLLAGSLRRLAAERPGAVLPNGFAAAGGTLAAGLVLAGADLATAGSGWGRLLQEPLAVTALAVVTLLVALALWGLLGRGRSAAPGAEKGTSSPAALLAAGALLPVLALPWALPPAATSLDRAAGLGPGIGLAAALLAAAGLALPLLAVAFVLHRRAPAANPRSAGHRTEALGFLALVSLLWQLYILAGLLDPEPLAFVELCLLGLGLAVWGGRSARRPGVRRAWNTLVALAAAAALWIAAVG